MDGGASGAGRPARRPQWRLADERCELRAEEMEYVRRFHRHEPGGHQCTSVVAKHVRAPVQTVWSLVRRFDQPQLFKPFVRECVMRGNIETGSVREVNVQSGLPATTSTERLELLDDNQRILSVKFVGGDHRLKILSCDHTTLKTSTERLELLDNQRILSVKFVGGDHRLKNYSSILTVHPEVIDGHPGALVIESFVVDVPEGNTKDDICYFVENLLRCNLKSLADVSEERVDRPALD